jgi:tetratricopeptide (TPR) repeat protein
MKNKMRYGLLVGAVVSLCNVAFAQTVDQGKKFLYYQRYKSAKEVFDKVLASNPNNIDAIYWQGQTLLVMKDSIAAQDLYAKALQTNGSAPLLLAGMGDVELRLGKLPDARQRFETAISLTKGKDIEVLNAIGRANVNARSGDAAYAIEKLVQATQIKKFNDPTTYLLEGDAYRKQIDGGNAVTSYNKALAIDTKLAEAKYKIGKIYLTQNNKEQFLQDFEDAIAMDPAYAPAYYELFYYWYFRDVNKAAPYLDKFIANTDAGPDVEYMKTDFLYSTSKFAEARDKAKALIAQYGDKVLPRMYKMVAYCCDTLGDVACASQYVVTYFQKQSINDFLPADYQERGHIEFKSTDSNVVNAAFADYEKAIAMDTVPKEREDLLAEATGKARQVHNSKAVAELAAIAYTTKKDPNQTDLYNWGFANYSAGNFKTADSIFCGIYETKYPTEIFGYLWCMRSKVAQDDSIGSQGLAVDAYQKFAEKAREIDSSARVANNADSNRWKNSIIVAYFQLSGYFNNIKKDKEQALFWLNKVLEVDPNNPDAKKFIEALTRPARQPARPAQGTRPRPAR